MRVLATDLESRLAELLDEAGFHSVGDLSIALKLRPDSILKLQGIGPKAMADIAAIVASSLQKYMPATIEEAEQPIVKETAALEEPVLAVQAEDQIDLAEALTFDSAMDMEPMSVASPRGKGAEINVAPQEESIEEDISFEDIFTLKPELLDPMRVHEDVDYESDDSLSAADKKKKKRKNQTIEFDPEANLVIKHKKHKRSGGGEWDWDV
jgi:N utilization substance protein A